MENKQTSDVNTPPILIRFSVFTTYDQRLTKKISLLNGKLVKENGGQMSSGTAETRQVEGIEGFADAMQKISCHQALTYGVVNGLGVGQIKRVVPKNQLHSELDAIARSNSFLFWSNSYGIYFMDYDPVDGETPLVRDELFQILHEIMPAARNVKKLWFTSASSLIYNTETGKQITGERGQRIYMVVSDARDIERIGEILLKRSWLAGYGRILVSKHGHLLVRSVFDHSVYQPCRLDFVAGAMCEYPLQQRRGEPQIMAGELEFLDVSLISELTDEEEQLYHKLVEEKKLELEPNAKITRQACIEKKVLQHAPEEQCKVRAKYSAMYENSSLIGDISLTVFVNGQQEILTVDQILKAPINYDKCRTLDPIEPEYGDYDDVGILNLSGPGAPNLFSFAHGGRSYRLAANAELAINDSFSVFGEYKLPYGYLYHHGAIYQVSQTKEGEKETLLINHAIAPTKIMQRLCDSRVTIEISFEIGNKRDRIAVPREMIASNDITGLAAYGVHVHSSNAKKLSKFLMAMELANRDVMDHNILVEKLGWLKIGDDECLLAGCNYVKAGKIMPISVSTNENMPFELHFPDAETGRIRRGLDVSGSFENWKLMAMRLDSFPYAKIAIIAAIISPWLTKLKMPGFVIHYGYPTSSGKSTILNLAASTFGKPNGESDGVVRSWNTTKVGIERISGVLNVLPVMLDETKAVTAKDKGAFISEVIYQHCLGISKCRGKPNGLQEQHSWTSIMISTGEANILSTVQDGGVKARILDLPDKPFKAISPEIANLIDSVNETIHSNYGHAILMTAAFLTAEQSHLKNFKVRFAEIEDDIRGELPSGIGTRLSKIIAVILAGGELINISLGLNWNMQDIRTAMLKPCLRVANQETEGRRALELAYEYSISHQLRDMDGRLGNTITKGHAVIGVVESDRICFLPGSLREIMKDHGFEYDAVIKEWHERGWIDVSNDKYHPYQKQTYVGDRRTWTIFINSTTKSMLEAESERTQACTPPEITQVCTPPWEYFDTSDLPDIDSFPSIIMLENQYLERIRSMLAYESPALSVFCPANLRIGLITPGLRKVM